MERWDRCSEQSALAARPARRDARAEWAIPGLPSHFNDPARTTDN